jgi:hypothetical protein
MPLDLGNRMFGDVLVDFGVVLRELQRIPLLRDVATDQQIAGPTVPAGNQPRRRYASGHPDTSHRRYALRCIWAAQDRPVLHPAE